MVLCVRQVMPSIFHTQALHNSEIFWAYPVIRSSSHWAGAWVDALNGLSFKTGVATIALTACPEFRSQTISILLTPLAFVPFCACCVHFCYHLLTFWYFARLLQVPVELFMDMEAWNASRSPSAHTRAMRGGAMIGARACELGASSATASPFPAKLRVSILDTKQ